MDKRVSAELLGTSIALPAAHTDTDLMTEDVTCFEQTDSMCNSCHAKMSPITASFNPSDRYFDHFDLITLVRVAKDLSHYLDAAHTRGDRRYLQWTPTALAF